MIHVLFDIDETLLHLLNDLGANTSRVMFREVFGIDADEDQVVNTGKTEKQIIKEVLEENGEVVTEIPDKAYHAWATEVAERLKEVPPELLPGAVEFLEALKAEHDVVLALLTGNSYWRSEAKLSSCGLDKYFRNSEGLLTGAFGHMSEERGNLLMMYRKDKLPGDKFVIVDDSIIGAELAKFHDTPIISVGTGKATIDQLKDFTPYVFPDLGEGRWKKAVEIIKSLT